MTLEKRRLPHRGGWIEVDAAAEEPPILCEVWAHQGPPKSAQKAKVMTDAMKLLFARSTLPEAQRERCRLLLVLADPAAAAHFQDKSWMAGALTSQGIEVIVVDLPQDVREQIRDAQRRQYR
ncbi:MAG: hypothetical protein GEU80_16700 [Dehalococcoidia bacterium]|nr:hypothetical protein [Dehalococcoidia bacterium]